MIDEPLRNLIRQTRLMVFDFDGVFTDNTVYVAQDGTESVRCWRSDGLGLQMLADLGLPALVLSTEENPVVSARCRKLKIECVQGLADKGAALKALCEKRGIPPGNAAYLGNDINDSGCLRAVGLPMVVQDAHADVVPLARYRTRASGGFGAVREVCELFRDHAAPARGPK